MDTDVSGVIQLKDIRKRYPEQEMSLKRPLME